MSHAATGYRPLLCTPGAPAFFLAAAVGRVGIAMTGLGLVWLLHARTGSYGTAGLAAAGFSVAEALVGWEQAAVLAATQILHMLEVPIREGRHDVVPGVVKRGHRALDELNALR